MKKVVAIGGGSGLATLLRSIRDYPIEISALVAMTDDGSSTGRLKKELDILPPGDIRKCIAALSDNESHLLSLFQHRFKRGLGIKGHSVGNLLITAMIEMYGNFELAVEGISDLLSIKGKVIPTTLDLVDLIAIFENGKQIKGESKIVRYGYRHKISSMKINKIAIANPKAIAAIAEADLILVGPGSLYTSILPNFLFSEVVKIYENSDAYKIFICNVSTEKGETDNYSVADHLNTLLNYQIVVDGALVNNNYLISKKKNAKTVPVKTGMIDKLSLSLIQRDLVNAENPLYHDTDKLGAAIWEILSSIKKYQRRKNF